MNNSLYIIYFKEVKSENCSICIDNYKDIGDVNPYFNFDKNIFNIPLCENFISENNDILNFKFDDKSTIISNHFINRYSNIKQLMDNGCSYLNSRHSFNQPDSIAHSLSYTLFNFKMKLSIYGYIESKYSNCNKKEKDLNKIRCYGNLILPLYMDTCLKVFPNFACKNNLSDNLFKLYYQLITIVLTDVNLELLEDISDKLRELLVIK